MKREQKSKMITAASSSGSMADKKKINIASRNIKKHAKNSEPVSKSINKPMKPMSQVQVEAEEFRSSLKADSNTFVKLMEPSIVGGPFWLGLPAEFCRSKLPEKITKFTLVDENGEECTAKYLPHRRGLSGGWREFSNDHELKKGDALIFHLSKDTELKVYIRKAPDNHEEESEEVLVRKRNARLKIMIQEQKLFQLRNDSLNGYREMVSTQDDQVKSDLAASSSMNALSLEK